ncbi:MAG: hypothetical protein H0U30_06885 [Actinobacteria bacterium]|nr:hypothetical protein [Actinomycetota bacterium]
MFISEGRVRIGANADDLRSRTSGDQPGEHCSRPDQPGSKVGNTARALPELIRGEDDDIRIGRSARDTRRPDSTAM